MVDKVNPTSQFHPYQPNGGAFETETPTTGLRGMLEKAGIKSDSLRNMDVKRTVDQARNYARMNPGKVLGGLAAAIIGAGLLSSRGRGLARGR
jgi:hypothetical protein